MQGWRRTPLCSSRRWTARWRTPAAREESRGGPAGEHTTGGMLQEIYLLLIDWSVCFFVLSESQTNVICLMKTLFYNYLAFTIVMCHHRSQTWAIHEKNLSFVAVWSIWYSCIISHSELWDGTENSTVFNVTRKNTSRHPPVWQQSQNIRTFQSGRRGRPETKQEQSQNKWRSPSALGIRGTGSLVGATLYLPQEARTPFILHHPYVPNYIT